MKSAYETFDQNVEEHWTMFFKDLPPRCDIIISYELRMCIYEVALNIIQITASGGH